MCVYIAIEMYTKYISVNYTSSAMPNITGRKITKMVLNDWLELTCITVLCY